MSAQFPNAFERFEKVLDRFVEQAHGRASECLDHPNIVVRLKAAGIVRDLARLREDRLRRRQPNPAQ